MTLTWDERYKGQEFAYGKAPNEFFKEWILKFTPGSILMPADGEGRNGVFAATQGWNVTSFDLSSEGKSKALQLAKENQVTLEYIVGDFEQLEFKKESFDAIALIYAHFSSNKKSEFHQRLGYYLKPGGIIIFEAFSKKHLTYYELNPKVGGRLDSETLFSADELRKDFKNYEFLMTPEEQEVILNEGRYHIGTGSVVRLVGRKPE